MALLRAFQSLTEEFQRARANTFAGVLEGSPLLAQTIATLSQGTEATGKDYKKTWCSGVHVHWSGRGREKETK